LLRGGSAASVSAALSVRVLALSDAMVKVLLLLAVPDSVTRCPARNPSVIQLPADRAIVFGPALKVSCGLPVSSAPESEKVSSVEPVVARVADSLAGPRTRA
jgi:hypothetical protein